MSSKNTCISLNTDWNEQLLFDLIDRFEEPDGQRCKWDRPLFTVHTSLQAEEDELPYQAIHDALYNSIIAPPNLSTIVKPASCGNYLLTLDKMTQQVIDGVLDAQRNNISIKGIDRFVGLVELRKIRAQFIHVNKMHPLPDEKIVDAFKAYLSTAIQE